MKSLGIKMKSEGDLYPSMTGSPENKVRYPSVSLPLSLLDKDMDLGEEVTLTLKGKITRVEKSKWAEEFSVDLTEGEAQENESKAEVKKEKTLIG